MSRRLTLAITILVVAFSILILLGREKRAAPTNPCLQARGRRIRVIYIVRRQSPKGAQVDGCALCDADNVDQWNALYRVFGGREDIEFVVILTKGSTFSGHRVLRFDLSIGGGDAAGERDLVIICDRGEKRLEHAGIIDMAFVREAYVLLARPQKDSL